MFYTDVILLKPPVFKRLTGVPPDTFLAMHAALKEHFPTADAQPNTACKTGF